MGGTSLFLSFLFSLIGMAVFIYGRRQRVASPLLIGALLMGYPYFVDSPVAIAGIGIALLVLLYFAMRFD